jgi:hypothetical protein
MVYQTEEADSGVRITANRDFRSFSNYAGALKVWRLSRARACKVSRPELANDAGELRENAIPVEVDHPPAKPLNSAGLFPARGCAT